MKRIVLFFAFLWLGIIGASAQVDRCDVNGDGEVDISDVTYVIDHVLGRGHASTPSEEAGEAIDLGLPSGTKWASCNVGATKPEEYGGYYAWGETEEKEVYVNSNYNYFQDGSYENIGSDISGTVYDVAHVKWGGNWCMPTLDDIKELLDNCTRELATLNGVNGRKFTSKINGNSIFLPAAGDRSSELSGVGTYGNYWSSTQSPDDSSGAYDLIFYSLGAYLYDFLDWNYVDWNFHTRDLGQSVRPVVRN